MVLNTLVYIVVLIVVVILIVVLLKFLFGVLAIAPIIAYGSTDQDIAPQTQKDAGSSTIETNDTEIHINCTENIKGLVAECG